MSPILEFALSIYAIQCKTIPGYLESQSRLPPQMIIDGVRLDLTNYPMSPNFFRGYVHNKQVDFGALECR